MLALRYAFFMSPAMSWLWEELVTVLTRTVLTRTRLHPCMCQFMSLAIRRLSEALVTMLARIRHHFIVCPFTGLTQFALVSR